MLVWVVLVESIRFTSEGNTIDKTVRPICVHKSFEEALNNVEERNGRLIDGKAKRITMPDGEILWTNYYVHRDPVYVK